MWGGQAQYLLGVAGLGPVSDEILWEQSVQHWPVLSYATRLRIDCQFYIGTWIIYNAEQWDQTMKHLQKRSSGEIEARKKCLCPQKCGTVVFWVSCSSSVVWDGVCLEIVWKIILVRTRLIPCVAWFLDIKKKETWSSKPSSTAPTFPKAILKSVAIVILLYGSFGKDPFSPYIWWGIVSTNNRFSAEVLLQVVSKTPSVSWSYAILSRVCVPSGVLENSMLVVHFTRKLSSLPPWWHTVEGKWMDSLTISFQQWQCRNNTTICYKTKGFIRYPVQLNSALWWLKSLWTQLLPDTAHVNRCKVRDLASFWTFGILSNKSLATWDQSVSIFNSPTVWPTFGNFQGMKCPSHDGKTTSCIIWSLSLKAASNRLKLYSRKITTCFLDNFLVFLDVWSAFHNFLVSKVRWPVRFGPDFGMFCFDRN